MIGESIPTLNGSASIYIAGSFARGDVRISRGVILSDLEIVAFYDSVIDIKGLKEYLVSKLNVLIEKYEIPKVDIDLVFAGQKHLKLHVYESVITGTIVYGKGLDIKNYILDLRSLNDIYLHRIFAQWNRSKEDLNPFINGCNKDLTDFITQKYFTFVKGDDFARSKKHRLERLVLEKHTSKEFDSIMNAALNFNVEFKHFKAFVIGQKPQVQRSETLAGVIGVIPRQMRRFYYIFIYLLLRYNVYIYRISLLKSNNFERFRENLSRTRAYVRWSWPFIYPYLRSC